MMLFRRTPCQESIRAKQRAAQSLERAEEDLMREQKRLGRTQVVQETVKAHNRSNHYSLMVENLVLGRS